MADIKYVVVVMMENRSFDEYFGTFPRANGFFTPSPAIPQPWPGQPGGVLYPYRASTFTTNAMSTPGLGHDWNTMHVSAGLDSADGSTELQAGADNLGFHSANSQPATMCYYARNDIPYHWALARSFALCDNYFCSALAGTGTNRMYITSGTLDPFPPPANNVYVYSPQTATWIFNYQGGAGIPVPPTDQQGPVIGNISGTSNYTLDLANPAAQTPQVAWTQIPWGSYLSDLRHSPLWSDSNPLYTVYDDWNWMPPWVNNAFTLYYGSFDCDDLNTFSYYNDGYGVRGDVQYKETIAGPTYQPDILLQFETDLAAGTLAPVTYLYPPYCLSEHPPFTSADGGYYLSRIVDAVLASQQWPNTVLVITYDETDAHFDHVPPPIAPDPRATPTPDPYEPWVSDTGGTNDNPFPVPAPMGAGMRVPAIIVSPWTYQLGVISDQMDHTSVLQMLETVTTVPASRLPAAGTSLAWRRANFANMFDVIQNSGSPTAVAADQIDRSQETGLPTQDIALQWQQTGWRRLAAIGIPPKPPAANPNGPLPPPAPNWPPVPQQIELILPVASFTLSQAMALPQSGGIVTLAGAVVVVVEGFEPVEFFDPNAINPTSQITVTNTTTPCTTRIPTFNFTTQAGVPISGVAAVNPTIDANPAPGTTAPGVPVTRTFTFDLILTVADFATLFPAPANAGTPNVILIEAIFTVDTTVLANAELELLAADDPQFFHDFTDNTVYLSGELRVFSLPAGHSLFGVLLPDTGNQQQDALGFIAGLISTMNDAQRNGTPLPTSIFPIGSQTMVSSFDDLNQQENLYPLSLTIPAPGQTPTLNFALARVHMQASTAAANVRVFFRCARASVTTSAYDAGTDNTHPAFYRNAPPTPAGAPPDDTKVPLLGVLPVLQQGGTAVANEYVTIPFFASPRITLDDSNPTMTMRDQPADTPNVITIPPSSGSTPVQTFFGCWLDINQTQAILPATPPANPAEWDGPWNPNDPNNPLLTIQQAFLRDLHQCLVAEISYDPLVIPPGDNPATSAWLAQRNLAFTQ